MSERSHGPNIHGGWDPDRGSTRASGPEGITRALRVLSDTAHANVLAHCTRGTELTEDTIRELSRQRLLNDDRTLRSGVCDVIRLF